MAHGPAFYATFGLFVSKGRPSLSRLVLVVDWIKLSPTIIGLSRHKIAVLVNMSLEVMPVILILIAGDTGECAHIQEGHVPKQSVLRINFHAGTQRVYGQGLLPYHLLYAEYADYTRAWILKFCLH